MSADIIVYRFRVTWSGPFVSYKLSAKAWEKAVQELGKAWNKALVHTSDIIKRSSKGKNLVPYLSSV